MGPARVLSAQRMRMDAARAILEPLAQMVAVTRGENSRRSELAPKAFQDKLLSLSKEFPLLSEEEREQLREEMEKLARGPSSAGAGSSSSSSSSASASASASMAEQ